MKKMGLFTAYTHNPKLSIVSGLSLLTGMLFFYAYTHPIDKFFNNLLTDTKKRTFQPITRKIPRRNSFLHAKKTMPFYLKPGTLTDEYIIARVHFCKKCLNNFFNSYHNSSILCEFKNNGTARIRYNNQEFLLRKEGSYYIRKKLNGLAIIRTQPNC